MVALQGSQVGSPAAGSAFTVERGSLHTSAFQEIVTRALKAASDEPLRLVPQKLAEIFGAARVTPEDVGISACSQFSTARNGSSSYLCDTENGHVVPSGDPNLMSQKYSGNHEKAENIVSKDWKEPKLRFEAVKSPELLAVSLDTLEGANGERSSKSTAVSNTLSKPLVTARTNPEPELEEIASTSANKSRFVITLVGNPDLARIVNRNLNSLRPSETANRNLKVGKIQEGPESVDGSRVIALNNPRLSDQTERHEFRPVISLDTKERREPIPA